MNSGTQHTMVLNHETNSPYKMENPYVTNAVASA